MLQSALQSALQGGWNVPLKRLALPPTGKEYSSDAFDSDENSYSANENGNSETVSKLKRNETISAWLKVPGFRDELHSLRSEFTELNELKIHSATWNVAGIEPHDDLMLDEWLQISDPADIYVIGLQEMVPLTTGSLLLEEDNLRVGLWENIIRKTLEKHDSTENETSQSTNDDFSLVLVENDKEEPKKTGDEQLIEDSTNNQTEPGLKFELDPISQMTENVPVESNGSVNEDLEQKTTEQVKENKDKSSKLDASNQSNGHQRKYSLVASKQLVGIYLSVWIRSTLRPFVHSVRVSCIGVGLMGILANKGAVALSMCLHETSFCFICSHLTAGEKDTDKQKRAMDISEILKRVYFPQSERIPSVPTLRRQIETINDHDQIIWVGDYNSRLDLPDEKIRLLIKKKNWQNLLIADQLKNELSNGVLSDWFEGDITFPPTYKYVFNSTQYFGDVPEDGEKRRKPAWTDRIVWKGDSPCILKYGRAEESMSDHRPVYATFSTSIHVIVGDALDKALTSVKSKIDARDYMLRPQCVLDPTNLHFDQLKYSTEQTRQVTIRNDGQVKIKFTISIVSNNHNSPPSWISASVKEAELEVGEAMNVSFNAFLTSPSTIVENQVDENGELSTIILFHLDGGGDLFLWVSASFIPSCWGISLKKLLSINEPISSLSLSSIVSLNQDNENKKEKEKGIQPNGDDDSLNTESKRNEENKNQIPRVVKRLLAFLKKSSADSNNRFNPSILLGSMVMDFDWSYNLSPSIYSFFSPNSQLLLDKRKSIADLESDIFPIRESLDNDSPFPDNATAQQIGSALISFLQALPHPLISPEVSAVIDSTDRTMNPSDALALLKSNLGSAEFAVLDSLIELVIDLVRNQIANSLAIQEFAYVYADAVFPEEGSRNAKISKRRCVFLKQLIEERLTKV